MDDATERTADGRSGNSLYEISGKEAYKHDKRRNYLLLCRIPKKYADEAAGELLQVLGRGK